MRNSFSITIGAAALGIALTPAFAVKPIGPPRAPGPNAMIAKPAVQPAVITQSSLEQTFTPVAQCIIYDTTKTHTPFTPALSRDYVVADSSNLSSQGGSPTGCGVPAYATAVSLSVTAVASSVDGYLALKQPGQVADFRTVSYTSGHGATSAAIVPLSNNKVTVYSSQAVHSSAYVNGFYSYQMEGLIYTGSSSSQGYVYSGSPRLLSVTYISDGVADVTVDRDVTYCTAIAGGYYDSNYYANAKAFNGNKVRVYSWDLNSTTHLPTEVNNYVYLTVHC